MTATLLGDDPVVVPERMATVPPGPRLRLVRAVLLVILALALALLAQLLIIGDLQQRSAQRNAFDQLRGQLASGTAPTGPTDAIGRRLELGDPVAYLRIPAIGLRQVIVEGTTPGALLSGPGHRRDSPLPGQAGVSVVFGRRAAFGGPFARLGELERGDEIEVTTGQGEFTYRVIGLREEGDPVPDPVPGGKSRMVLTTATGQPFVPDGVLRVDADIVGSAVVGPRPLVESRLLPAAEQVMGIDTSTVWALVLWLQALLLVACGAIWCWYRIGRAKTWVIAVPPLLLVGLAASGQVVRLMPNML